MKSQINVKSIGDVLQCRLDRIINDAANESIHTGFSIIDKVYGGLHNSQVIILASRPGEGKTSFMLNLAVNISREGVAPTAIFSTAVSAEYLASVILQQQCGVPLYKFRNASKLLMEDLKSLTDAVSSIKSLPLYFEDTPCPRVEDLVNKVHSLVNSYGVKVIFIDDLQSVENPYSSTFCDKNGLLFQILKHLADELCITIVVLSSFKKFGNRKPCYKDLERSGLSYDTLDEYIDIVAALYRSDWAGMTDSECDTAQLVVLHNKHGRRDISFDLTFDSDTSSFKDIQDPEFTNNNPLHII